MRRGALCRPEGDFHDVSRRARGPERVPPEHSRAWNAEALAPLVAERPDCAPFIAEGALMRLMCGAQCFEAYRAALWARAAAFAAA